MNPEPDQPPTVPAPAADRDRRPVRAGWWLMLAPAAAPIIATLAAPAAGYRPALITIGILAVVVWLAALLVVRGRVGIVAYSPGTGGPELVSYLVSAVTTAVPGLLLWGYVLPRGVPLEVRLAGLAGLIAICMGLAALTRPLRDRYLQRTDRTGARHDDPPAGTP